MNALAETIRTLKGDEPMLRLLVLALVFACVILPAASANLAVCARLKSRLPPSTVRVIHFGILAYSALACR
jgi:hypothetical protein